jgi:hypothetical protein
VSHNDTLMYTYEQDKKPADIAAEPRKNEPSRVNLWLYLLHWLEHPEAEGVNDIVRTVYLRFRRTPSYELVADPRARFHQIAEEAIVSQEQDAIPDGVDHVVRLKQHVDETLVLLPPIQAAILLGKIRDGLSDEELASKLEISVELVHKYLSSAKAQIRMRYWK